MFAIEWNCWYPDNEECNRPQELHLNRVTTPFSYALLPPPPPLFGGLEGRLKSLRILNKVGFEKNLSLQGIIFVKAMAVP